MNKNHAFKWVIQRITAIILIPTSLWFIYQCISFQNFEYYDFKVFFKSYFNSLLFLLMMCTMLIHAKLGCETIVEDYVSSYYLKKYSKYSINFITILSLFLLIIAIIRINII